MRSLFKSTFQPARRVSSGFQPALAGPRRPSTPVVELGVNVFADQRNAILTKITNGNQRLLAVRQWIASRIDQDPMLLKTFGEKYISDNFWGYDDIVTKDQYYVDLASQALTGDLEMWDLDDETIGRVDEWAAVIDIMYAAMQEYGKTPLTTPAGTQVPNTVAPPPTAPPASPTGSGGKVPAGSSVKTPPPAGAGGAGGMFLGIPSKDALLYGGIGLGVIVLIAIAKKMKDPAAPEPKTSRARA
jgi:hypothetical protein